MQVGQLFAHTRKHVADVRRARAFGSKAFLERRNLIHQVRQRAAGVRRRRLGVGGGGRVRTKRVPLREKTFARRLGPCAWQPCPQIPAFVRPGMGHGTGSCMTAHAQFVPERTSSADTAVVMTCVHAQASGLPQLVVAKSCWRPTAHLSPLVGP